MAKTINLEQESKNEQFVPTFKSIEEMYQFFLKLNKLDEQKMDKDEYIERRRTFYGASALMFDTIVHNMGGKSQEDVNKILDKIQTEIHEFIEKQKGRF